MFRGALVERHFITIFQDSTLETTKSLLFKIIENQLKRHDFRSETWPLREKEEAKLETEQRSQWWSGISLLKR